MDIGPESLYLRAISALESGEMVTSVCVPPDRMILIGRSSEADWAIPDSSVSRRHASIVRTGDAWIITDLSSRHGTLVNGRRLEPGAPEALHDRDVIAFGAWQCRCMAGSRRAGVTTPFAPALGASVSAIPKQQLEGVAQRGLEVLMQLTEALEGADTRERVAQATVNAVREATGCRRVVLVEPDSESELMVLASTTKDSPRVSRSLIEQASRHGLVQLMVEDSGSRAAQSIIEMGIRSAICAPIIGEGCARAFLVVDTRDAEGVVPADAGAFCQSVSRVAGLALGRISAALMTERHRQLQGDLEAARRAQELLSPARRGRLGSVAYQFESIPGRVVAGDLFDIFALDPIRTAFFLGDVSGKGVGAAMLMAACQSQLRTHLLSGVDLSDAMARVSADLFARTAASKFVTVIAGVIDTSRGSLRVVDAGHGHFLVVTGTGSASRIEAPGGFPLGVVERADYEAAEIPMREGGGIVVFSDGAVEQPDGAGRQFGMEGVMKSVMGVGAPHEAVDALIREVTRHASGTFADDLTAASIWIQRTD